MAKVFTAKAKKAGKYCLKKTKACVTLAAEKVPETITDSFAEKAGNENASQAKTKPALLATEAAASGYTALKDFQEKHEQRESISSQDLQSLCLSDNKKSRATSSLKPARQALTVARNRAQSSLAKRNTELGK